MLSQIISRISSIRFFILTLRPRQSELIFKSCYYRLQVLTIFTIFRGRNKPFLFFLGSPPLFVFDTFPKSNLNPVLTWPILDLTCRKLPCPNLICLDLTCSVWTCPNLIPFRCLQDTFKTLFRHFLDTFRTTFRDLPNTYLTIKSCF